MLPQIEFLIDVGLTFKVKSIHKNTISVRREDNKNCGCAFGFVIASEPVTTTFFGFAVKTFKYYLLDSGGCGFSECSAFISEADQK